MLNLSVKKVRGFYLDRRFFGIVDKDRKESLNHWAASVRQRAQWSMRDRKPGGKPSQPGRPPKAVEGGRYGRNLRKKLSYAWKVIGRSVVVGPELLGQSNVAALHEFGGVAPNKRRRFRRPGSGGEIRVSSRPLPGIRTAKQVAGDPAKRWVVYARLTSAGQVRRANAINADLYGPMVLRYPPRPYMQPAFEKMSTQSKMREYFPRRSFRRAA